MAQDIHPEIRTERGEVVGPDPAVRARLGGVVARLVSAVDLGPFALLSGIDPYGHTVFNRVQLPRLLAELTTLEGSAPPDLCDGIRELAAVVASQIDQVHMYLWFVGD